MGESTAEWGGLGGEPARTIRDTRLAERAIRERWAIPEKTRDVIVERLAAIINPRTKVGKNASLREVVSAARALVAADKLNLEQAKLDYVMGAGEKPDDDFVIDISTEDDQAQPLDGPPA